MTDNNRGLLCGTLHPQNYGLTLGLHPIGDWTFDQPYKDGFQKLEADSWENLIQTVRQFRINVGLPIGDPAAEVSDAVRARSPMNDIRRSRSAPFRETRHRPIEPLIQRIKDWLMPLNSRQLELVSQDEADKRSTICATCSQNIEVVSSCIPCIDDVNYRSNIARRRTSYHYDKKLRGCRLHGMKLQTAVFLSEEDLPPRHEQAPNYCWIP